MTESESEVRSLESIEAVTESAKAEPHLPPRDPVKVDALRRLRALERRGKTVATHLDESVPCSPFFLKKCRINTSLKI